MTIDSPIDSDWGLFLSWAKGEGWRVPARELELFRGPLAEGAFVLRKEEEPRGFVTAVRHEKSGWIGNLIVDPECRGRGMGAILFEHAVDCLQRRGVASVWLTASTMGRPIYERRGFRLVGGIVRWRRPPVGKEPGADVLPGDMEALFAADSRGWGESRQGLLRVLTRGGIVSSCGETAALLQVGTELQILGPWHSPSLCPRENRRVLTALLDAAAPGTEVVTDILEDSPVQPLLAAAGFEPRGRCDLMVHGPNAADLTSVVALASLGSMG